MPKGKILMGKKPPKPGPKPGDPMLSGRPVPGLGIKPKPVVPKKPGRTKPVLPKKAGK
jgi:hypothetical protein